ncbi:hypothetical protein BFR04_03515 [Gaetbulibacter sp. 4G1]|nr:hypothetical protein BFR04_03515 [Gaetbulibacter sp. 4G1]
MFININAQIGFQKHSLSTTFESASSTRAVDLDSDGDLDIVANNSNKLVWFENIDGVGSFSNEKIIDEGSGFSVIKVVDIDNDSDMDILISSGRLSYYENTDGFGNFSDKITIPTEYSIRESFSVVDIDKDGLLDVVVATMRPSGSGGNNDGLVWHKNLGINQYGFLGWSFERGISGFNDFVDEILTYDIDDDNDLDVIVTLRHDVYLFENLEVLGTFSGRKIITNEVSGSIYERPTEIYISDIDKDGDGDIISGISSIGRNDRIVWYENEDSLGSFGDEKVIDVNDTSFYWSTSIDIDNDGDQDIICLSYSERKIFWYENVDAKGNFGARQEIADAELNYPKGIGKGDIDFDGDIDIVIPIRLDDEVVWFENLGLLGNTIEGNILSDTDLNGCDSNDLSTPSIMVTSDNGTNSFSTFTQPNGNYLIYTNPGDFTTSITTKIPEFYTLSPDFHSSNFVGLSNTDTADFCLAPTQKINDVSISLLPTSQARPGFDASYQIVLNNVGTNQLSGTIILEFDDSKLSFITASEIASEQIINSLTFNYTGLNPFETRIIDVDFNVKAPPTTNINDVLSFVALINPVSEDYTEDDNVFELNQTVIGSYDPNDILVLEGNEILLEDTDEYLHYIIRFQNTGTADAINVRVDNILDPNLDWNTIQLESYSHTNRVEIKDGNQVSFIFNGIYLPDSTTDEPNSHGFIAYKIKPKESIAIGDIMLNKADIFFDFNLPIITNTVSTEIANTLSINKTELSSFQIYPNPTVGLFNIKSKSRISEIEIYNNLGQIVVYQIDKTTIDVSLLNTGLYFIKIKDEIGNSEIKKFIKE